jgi:outer membrane immunogenic protein
VLPARAAGEFEDISMKRTLGGMVVAAALSGSALAADLPPRSYDKAPAMAAPITNWSGLYIGGNVGYGWGNGNTDFTFLPAATSDIANATVDTKPKGVIGGAQTGYNWQMGSLVTGLEADIQSAGIKGTAAPSQIIATDGANVPGDFLSSKEKLSWFGTVRGRLGVTVTPDLLLFATGGLAYGHVEASANAHFINPFDFPGSVSKTKVGWTAGVGTEWRFARNWSAKAEYLYVDLGSASALGTDVTTSPSLAVGYTWKTKENIARVGVNYHFN